MPEKKCHNALPQEKRYEEKQEKQQPEAEVRSSPPVSTTVPWSYFFDCFGVREGCRYIPGRSAICLPFVQCQEVKHRHAFPISACYEGPYGANGLRLLFTGWTDASNV